MSQPTHELFHLSLHPSQPTTLILLHGLLSSHLEFTHLIPHLTAYHLLLVDLPGHSRSIPSNTSTASSSQPTIPAAADAVAALIRTHAHGSVAHVIGVSMGGFIALDLARRYPALCSSVFATGAQPFGGTYAWFAARPAVPYYLFRGVNALPGWLYWWMVGWSGMARHEELREEMKGNTRWEVVKGVYESILRDVGWEEIRGVNAVRTLNVAAGKGDDVEAARRVGRVWRETGVRERLGSRAVLVRQAVHAWDLQLPELFAKGVKAWVEGSELPVEFESLG